MFFPQQVPLLTFLVMLITNIVKQLKMHFPLSSILLSLLVFATTSVAFLDLRVELTHVDARRNFTKPELLHRAARRSQARMAWLSAVQAAAPGVDPNTLTKSRILVSPGEGEYLMDLAIGTPPLPFTAILDTGNDLIWTQCKPCIKCLKVPAPPFDPTKSSTYSALPCASKLCQALPNNCSVSPDQKHCVYRYSYGDSTSSFGTLATETFTFGSVAKVRVPGLGFGCGYQNGGDLNSGSGIVGFGRNPLSLISQLGIQKFSYCLTPLFESESKKSTLFFGPLADITSINNGPVLTTPLLQNPSVPTFYYVSLLGITVGEKQLKLPKSAFQLRKNGTGGVIVDSGTLVTGLIDVAYKKAAKAFKSYIKLPVVKKAEETGPFGLCFRTPTNDTASVEVPQLVFHFQGADMDLPRENYMFQTGDRVLCVNIFSNGDSSVVGNIQQHNMKVLFDLEKERLSFAPAQCDKL